MYMVSFAYRLHFVEQRSPITKMLSYFVSSARATMIFYFTKIENKKLRAPNQRVPYGRKVFHQEVL